MTSPPLDRGLHRVLYAVAALIIIEPLLLLGTIVVGERWPGYLWLPIALWIGVTLAIVAWIVRDLRASGIGLVARPALPGVLRVLAGVTLATVAFIVAAILDETRVWLWTIAYVVAIFALVAWMVRWQASHLAFRCDACGTVFEAGAGTWTFSVNMGDHKRVRCPNCGHHWAAIVDRSEA